MTMETAVRTATWAIDPIHSSAEFAVRHLMISTVKGHFNDLSGTLYLDEDDLANSRAELTIQVGSVDTREETRDNHLRSADFFDAANHPTMTFVSRRVEHVSGDDYRIVGDLTIHGTTREVVLDGTIDGWAKDYEGKGRVGLTATTKLSRKDYGLNFNFVLEGGGVMVGDEAKIIVHVEAVKQE